MIRSHFVFRSLTSYDCFKSLPKNVLAYTNISSVLVIFCWWFIKFHDSPLMVNRGQLHNRNPIGITEMNDLFHCLLLRCLLCYYSQIWSAVSCWRSISLTNKIDPDQNFQPSSQSRQWQQLFILIYLLYTWYFKSHNLHLPVPCSLAKLTSHEFELKVSFVHIKSDVSISLESWNSVP